MAVTVASFKVSFPEFAFAGDDMLAAQLAHVEATTGDGYDTEAKRDYVVMLTLADAIAVSPMGRDANLLAEGAKSSTYRLKLWGLMKGNACLHESRWGTPAEATDEDP